MIRAGEVKAQRQEPETAHLSETLVYSKNVFLFCWITCFIKTRTHDNCSGKARHQSSQRRFLCSMDVVLHKITYWKMQVRMFEEQSLWSLHAYFCCTLIFMWYRSMSWMAVKSRCKKYKYTALLEFILKYCTGWVVW